MPRKKIKKTRKRVAKTFCPYCRLMVKYTKRGYRMICAACKQRID